MKKKKMGRPLGSGIPKDQIQAYIPIPLKQQFDSVFTKRQKHQEGFGLSYSKTGAVIEAVNLYIKKYN